MNFDISKANLQRYLNAVQWDIDEAQRLVNQAKEEMDEAMKKQTELHMEIEAAKEELANLMRLEISEALMPAIKSENKPTL